MTFKRFNYSASNDNNADGATLDAGTLIFNNAGHLVLHNGSTAGGIGVASLLNPTFTQDVIVTGNVIAGNVISSSITTVNRTELVVASNLLNLHTQPNLAPWTFDDHTDIGIKFHYYKTQDSTAFLGLANDTGYLEWYNQGTDDGNIFSGTSYGTIKAGSVILNGGINLASGITWTGGSTVFEDTVIAVRGAVGVAISSPGSTQITAGSSQWTFDNTGNLTLPNTSFINYANGHSILSGINSTGNITFVDTTIQGNSTDPNVYVETVNGITAHTWTFDQNSNLTLPGNIIFSDLTHQTTAWVGSTNQLVNGSYSVALASDGSLHLPTSQYGTAQLYGPAGESLFVGTLDSGNYWQFKTGGALQFPDSTVQTTAYTGFGNANVAAYLVQNPQTGTYSNANVASYLTANPVVPGNVIVSNVATAVYYPVVTANVTGGSTGLNAVGTGLKYSSTGVGTLAGAGSAIFGTSVQTSSITAAATGVSIFNTTATTISMGGQAANILIGNASGTSSNVIFGGTGVSGGQAIGNVYAGNVTATHYGDGSHLTGVTATTSSLTNGTKSVSLASTGTITLPSSTTNVTIDATNANVVTLNTNGTITFTTTSGEILVNDLYDGWVYKFIVGGGRVSLAGTSNPNWNGNAIAQVTASVTSYASMSYTGSYVFTNLAASRNYNFVVIKTRNSA